MFLSILRTYKYYVIIYICCKSSLFVRTSQGEATLKWSRHLSFWEGCDVSALQQTDIGASDVSHRTSTRTHLFLVPIYLAHQCSLFFFFFDRTNAHQCSLLDKQLNGCTFMLIDGYRQLNAPLLS